MKRYILRKYAKIYLYQYGQYEPKELLYDHCDHNEFKVNEKFEDFISAITQSLYSGNYIDEFKYTKALVDSAYDNDKVIVEQVTAPVDNATAKAFLKKVRALCAVVIKRSSI